MAEQAWQLGIFHQRFLQGGTFTFDTQNKPPGEVMPKPYAFVSPNTVWAGSIFTSDI